MPKVAAREFCIEGTIEVPDEGPCYIGIDPGASGGLCCLSAFPEFITMPKTEGDVYEWVENNCCRRDFAVIEKVGGFIAGNPAPGSAMFKFGAGYGGLRMALIAVGVPFEEVTPQRWQRGLEIPPRRKSETKTQWKNRLRAFAQQLFPAEKITLAVSDAMLIAEFCRRKREGKLA
jgi:hypothetical protein